MENVEKKLKLVLEACEKRHPSILVLDDLDQLCPCPSATEELHIGADLASERLVQCKVFCAIITRVRLCANFLSANLIYIR